MIYLIGGPPRCGKTTVARRLATLTGASVVPIDYLGSVVYHYLSPAERARRFPSWEGSLDEIYATHSASEIVAHYRIIARTLWPAIQVYSHFALAHQQDVILEGYHVEPALMEEFLSQDQMQGLQEGAVSKHTRAMMRRGTGYAQAHRNDPRIAVVFLYKLDATRIAATLTTGTDPHDWVRRAPITTQTAHRIASMIGLYGRHIRDEAAKCGLPAVNMDESFPQATETAVASLLRRSNVT
jgi:hypothetical protein